MVATRDRTVTSLVVQGGRSLRDASSLGEDGVVSIWDCRTLARVRTLTPKVIGIGIGIGVGVGIGIRIER